MKKINHIVISGNIGVGKTTLSEKISKKFNWELQLEEVKDNPYLDDFYKSMKDWSFHLQIFFLNSRFNQIQKISESNNVVIQDRSIYEDYEVFTKTLYDSGVLMEREFNNYKGKAEKALDAGDQESFVSNYEMMLRYGTNFDSSNPDAWKSEPGVDKLIKAMDDLTPQGGFFDLSSSPILRSLGIAEHLLKRTMKKL